MITLYFSVFSLVFINSWGVLLRRLTFLFVFLIFQRFRNLD